MTTTWNAYDGDAGANLVEQCYDSEDEFYKGKLNTGRFYMGRILPKVYFYKKILISQTYKQVMKYKFNSCVKRNI